MENETTPHELIEGKEISDERLAEIKKICQSVGRMGKGDLPQNDFLDTVTDEELINAYLNHSFQYEFSEDVGALRILMMRSEAGKKFVYKLAKDSDSSAIITLRYTDDEEAAKILSDIVSDIRHKTESGESRTYFLYAISAIRSLVNKNYGFVGDELIKDTYAERLEVRGVAFYALRGKPGDQVTRRLIEGVALDRDGWSQLSAVLALKDREGDDVTQALINVAKTKKNNRGNELRLCALWALKGRQGQEVEEVLSQASPEELIEADKMAEKKIHTRELD
ncbi:MAG: hypothetical protein WCX71_04375 [Candidatus Buchananbacteria bacterium]